MSRDIWFLGGEDINSQSDTASLPGSLLEEDEAVQGYTGALGWEHHVAQNLENYRSMDKNLQEVPDQPGNYKLVTPTASKIMSKCVFPGVYMGGDPVESINNLAVLLGAPEDWMARLGPVVENESVQRVVQIFRNVPAGTPETIVETKFSGIVTGIAVLLGEDVSAAFQISFGVGGLLPEPDHAVVGKSDYVYQDGASVTKFVTEMKTREAYPDDEVWYFKSRAIQATGALYFSGAPVLLCSPESFKLLVLAENFDNICYFPSGNVSGSTTQDSFIQAIGLLIMSQRNVPNETPVRNPRTPPRIPTLSNPATVEREAKRRRSNRPRGSARDYTVPSSGGLDEPEEQVGDNGSREVWFLSEYEIDVVLNPRSTPQVEFESAAVMTEYVTEEWSAFESEKNR